MRLSELIKKEATFNELLNAIDGGASPVLCTGVGRIHSANIIGEYLNSSEMPVCVVCADENEASHLASDIEGFCGIRGEVLSGRELSYYNAEGVSREAEHKRLQIMYKMATGKARLIFATVEGLALRTIPREKLTSCAFTIKMGESYDIDEICDKLATIGYTRSRQVEGVGQFAVRGGIFDFYSPAMSDPVRCEFFGDDIDSMGVFDVETQRRTEMIDEAFIIPAWEVLPDNNDTSALSDKLSQLISRIKRRKDPPEEIIKTIEKDIERLNDVGYLPSYDRYIDLIYEKANAAEMANGDYTVFLYEPRRLSERARAYNEELALDVKMLMERGAVDGSIADYAYKYEEICNNLANNAVVMLDNFASGRYMLNPKTLLSMTARQIGAYGGSMETAVSDITYYKRENYKIVVLCPDRRRAQNLAEELNKFGIEPKLDYELSDKLHDGDVTITVGLLSEGFEYPTLKLAVITEGQIIRQNTAKKKKRHKNSGQKLESFTDLTYGDLVVHEQYGIGRFMGIVKMPVDGKERDYIKIAYAGSDKLYVPATSLDAVSKYIGVSEDKQVKLSKMGGTDWVKSKSKAKSAAKDLAKGLVELQAARMKEIGYAFSPDTPWQGEFEDAFEYTETDDQLTSVAEIKADMERPVPMDRLLCGDVGYGKTEVALRAIMKCIMDGKQAAILVPTTVLAQQHFVTATRRFGKLPVQVEVLSRYKTPAQMRKTVRDIAAGSADLVIGTHRLLQKDIVFKDLGLLVIDEEQRFGVSHKERLKEMSKGVDVLTLSATPIPRTLNMALSGIRDMSTLEEPPQDRRPVQTYVLEHEWGVLVDAMKREVSRGGQVYYLHNRVENIESVAMRISELLEGEATVAVAHGQMDEESLSSVMERMVSGETQILVCTTIIETGIDIPNVNTLIIEDADKMGLAQLHQLRGRVGRSHRRAYAYFTFKKDKALSEVATKRLAAIREFAEFNSGFKIAMRDLEIRGAGNILGAEQSGHMMSVGYDMYLKILEEAVLEEKGETPKKRVECSADLLVSAYIPQTYMANDEERMDFYRRIAHVRADEDANDIIDELVDRYGDIPKSVNMLVRIALLRGSASEVGISEITQKGDYLRFKIENFDMAVVSRIYQRAEYKNVLKVEAGNSPALGMRISKNADVIKIATDFVKIYGATVKELKNE